MTAREGTALERFHTTPSRSQGWIELLGPAADLAERISRTEFVPKAFKNRPEATLAAIMAGDALGLHPMQALAEIHIIDGRPCLSALVQRGLVLSHGHEVVVEESTDTHATVYARRSDGLGEARITWTLDQAKRAGLAGKTNWKNYPRQMLVARASSEACRLIAADVLTGVAAYTVEEVGDGAAVDLSTLDDTIAEPDTAPAAPAGTVARQRKPRAARTPPPPAEVPAPPLPEPDEPAGDAATTMPNDQLIAMRAAKIKLDHHLVVRAVTNGKKESAKRLTSAEAADVLTAISGLTDGTKVLSMRDDDTPEVLDFDADVDRPITEEEREVIAGPLEALPKEQRSAMAAQLVGIVPNYKTDRFTYRHMLIVADRLDGLIDAAAGSDLDGESAAEPDPDYEPGQEPFS